MFSNYNSTHELLNDDAVELISDTPTSLKVLHERYPQNEVITYLYNYIYE